ncbi:hypothetical protein FSP39_025033 [Pinctada imbricata]|uniref:Uncharacterized protein n=1 Tax=Pinctada imbricata TaxID=66713 RepID=A0AA88YP00_PINIB|nr:hypothetical protein FSP39_025033 [Pinctada imbricata]
MSNRKDGIPELALESTAHKQNCPLPIIIIPPFVFLYFLLILSYTQLNKPVERKAVLYELHSIIYNDNTHHVPLKTKAISWEILGICQQLCGKYVGAYHSYVNAINDEHNEFKEATIFRILSLLFDLHNHS